MSFDSQAAGGVIALLVTVGALALIAGLTYLCCAVQVRRPSTGRWLQDAVNLTHELAADLRARTRADGFEARVQLIRAAEAAMREADRATRVRP